ncbi:hypothetical protein MMC31_003460, partial [Peltigera leucophlebia]|nr:hypothetical protein [Peltigera leucophlebia]
MRKTTQIWTDASGNYGMGGYIPKKGQTVNTVPVNQMYSKRFTSCLRPKNINVKEMTAILHLLQKGLPIVKGSRLILHCDNFVVATGVGKTSIRGQAMHSLWAIAMFCALLDVE